MKVLIDTGDVSSVATTYRETRDLLDDVRRGLDRAWSEIRLNTIDDPAIRASQVQERWSRVAQTLRTETVDVEAEVARLDRTVELATRADTGAFRGTVGAVARAGYGAAMVTAAAASGVRSLAAAPHPTVARSTGTITGLGARFAGGSGIRMLRNPVSAVTGAVVGTATTVGGGIKDITVGAVKGAGGLISDLGSGAGSVLSGVGGWFKDKWSRLKKWAKKVMRNLGAWAEEAWGTFKAEMDAFWETIKSRYSGVSGMLRLAGDALILAGTIAAFVPGPGWVVAAGLIVGGVAFHGLAYGVDRFTGWWKNSAVPAVDRFSERFEEGKQRLQEDFQKEYRAKMELYIAELERINAELDAVMADLHEKIARKAASARGARSEWTELEDLVERAKQPGFELPDDIDPVDLGTGLARARSGLDSAVALRDNVANIEAATEPMEELALALMDPADAARYVETKQQIAAASLLVDSLDARVTEFEQVLGPFADPVESES